MDFQQLSKIHEPDGVSNMRQKCESGNFKQSILRVKGLNVVRRNRMKNYEILEIVFLCIFSPLKIEIEDIRSSNWSSKKKTAKDIGTSKAIFQCAQTTACVHIRV